MLARLRMKRFLAILFITILLGLGTVHLLFRDQIDLIEMVRAKLSKTKKVLKMNRAESKIVNDPTEPPRKHNQLTPQWGSDASKQRYLELQYTIGGNQEDHRFSFRKVIDLEFADSGNLFVLDFNNKSIELFDARGQHVRTLGIGKNRDRLLLKPTDLEVDEAGRVYVADRRKGVLVLNSNGKLLKTITSPYKIEQIALNSQNQIVALTPANKYLLHKLNTSGREILTFGFQEEASAALRQVFGQAMLAMDSNDYLYVSFQYPYKIMKFSAAGRALLEFDRPLQIAINPPTIYRRQDGSIKQVFRQQISYDLKMAEDGLLYNLVRTKGAKAADVLDAFSAQGDYLQRFYLVSEVSRFAIWENYLALLVSLKKQEISVYKILEVNE